MYQSDSFSSQVLRAELTFRKLILFKDVDDECLHELARRASLIKFSAGSWVARKVHCTCSLFAVCMCALMLACILRRPLLLCDITKARHFDAAALSRLQGRAANSIWFVHSGRIQMCVEGRDVDLIHQVCLVIDVTVCWGPVSGTIMLPPDCRYVHSRLHAGFIRWHLKA